MRNSDNVLYKLAREVTLAGADDVAYDGLRVLQHPARFQQFLTGDGLSIVPVTVELWPSLSCDARCPTCPFRISDARNEADAEESLHLINMDVFRWIISSLEEAGVKSVFLTGGGEPLLHPMIGTIAEDLNRSNLSWAGFTNGSQLTPATAERLFRSNPAFFRVSFDAGNARLYRETYGGKGEEFELVKVNIMEAGKVAAKIGYKGFGVGFSLLPNIKDSDLIDIRDALIQFVLLSNGGVAYATFRPRVVHYRNNAVLVPQKWSGQYHNLAQRIRDIVVTPISDSFPGTMRFDHKFGAFSDSDRDIGSTGGWGASWITTIDHLGRGYTMTEMCGSSSREYIWGDLSNGKSFLSQWNSEKRREAQKAIIDQKIGIPVANRFREIDAFLNRVKALYPNSLDKHTALAALEGVNEWDFHKSSRYEFV